MRFFYDLLTSLAVWLALVPYELIRRVVDAERHPGKLPSSAKRPQGGAPDALIGGGTMPAIAPAGFRRFSTTTLQERLGLTAFEHPGAILVHAVSLGELAAATPLIRELAPHDVVLTVGTGDARRRADALMRELPNLRAVQYLPWDRRARLERWLRDFDPAAIAVVETEIWPGLFFAAGATGIPLLIVSGRLYPKDVARYRLARGFFADVLRSAAWIGVQSSIEAERFVEIGAPPDRVEVSGNLKWDVEIRPRSAERMVLAANTHRGEEELIASAVRDLGVPFDLVLAPRHVRRAKDVTAIAPRSRIIDRVGVLAEEYERAALTILGGTFVTAGGHSPIEAAAAGCPIVCGPHTGHVEELVAPLRDAGALIQLGDARELPGALRALIEDPERLSAMSARARDVVRAHQGTARRYAAKTLDLGRKTIERGCALSGG